MTRAVSLRIAALASLCVPIAACSVIPRPPEPLPSEWIPSATPDPIDPVLLDSPLGFDAAERSAVRIRTSTCDAFGTGSGFVLDEHTIVTNQHVVEDYQWIEIETSDGHELTATSVSTSDVADVAIVTTEETLAPVVALADADPVLGDFVRIVGYPLGEHMTSSTGSVLEQEEDTLNNADHVFLTTATAEHGSSGSAVYGIDGRVIGVLYAGDEETKQGVFIPISIVKEALDDLDSLAAVTACPTY